MLHDEIAKHEEITQYQTRARDLKTALWQFNIAGKAHFLREDSRIIIFNHPTMVFKSDVLPKLIHNHPLNCPHGD